MGPFIQYAAEKPADPVELRIYPGADGDFTLYEDENDNYDYEKGVYATITFHWDDAKRQLTIDDRKGSFPGMLNERTFDVVVVRQRPRHRCGNHRQPGQGDNLPGQPAGCSNVIFWDSPGRIQPAIDKPRDYEMLRVLC